MPLKAQQDRPFKSDFVFQCNKTQARGDRRPRLLRTKPLIVFVPGIIYNSGRRGRPAMSEQKLSRQESVVFEEENAIGPVRDFGALA